MKLVQQISYALEIKNLMEQQDMSSSSSLKTLHPFIEKDCLLKEGGRLQQSTLPYQTMHMTILPAKHHFTKLVVSAEHIRLHHAGPLLLIAFLRGLIWIRRMRDLVRTVIYQCISCYRFKAQATQQLMGELPSTRVQTSRPFLATGLDYAGRISLRLKHHVAEEITNGYIAIFVCFVTKAFHIEVFKCLSTEAFLAALRRFILR